MVTIFRRSLLNGQWGESRGTWGSVVAFAIPGTETERIVVVSEAWSNETGEVVARIKTQVQRDLLLPLADVVLVQRGTVLKTSSGKLQRWRVRNEYLNNTLPSLENVGSSQTRSGPFDSLRWPGQRNDI